MTDVQRNVETISKQLSVAEEAYDRSIADDEEDSFTSRGLPLSEIIEELDDDGNVICM